MKFSILFFGAAFAHPERRAADIIDCPARCWEVQNGLCVPEAGKISLDCSTVGEISVSVDSCLFTPENADYNQLYQVYFNSTTSLGDPNCVKNITAANDVLTYSLTYSEAEACGWEWSTTATQLVFDSFLRPSANINKVTVQGHTVTIAQFPDDIDLTCNYDNHVTVSADFDGYMSNFTQNATRYENVSLADGFSVALKTDGSPITKFTVGENVTAEFSYDYAGAGHTLTSMPFGFFAERCYVENKLDSAQQLNMIGGGATPDTCKMDNSILNLHVSRLYAGANTDWSVSQYDLTFDAFKFQTSNQMQLVCEFQLCLTSDCTALTTTTCPYIY